MISLKEFDPREFDNVYPVILSGREIIKLQAMLQIIREPDIINLVSNNTDMKKCILSDSEYIEKHIINSMKSNEKNNNKR